MPLTWSAPSGSITDYVVQYALAGSGSWSTFSHSVSTVAAQTVTGLTASTSYDFRVAATGPGGQGTFSDTVTASTAAASSLAFSVDFTTAGSLPAWLTIAAGSPTLSGSGLSIGTSDSVTIVSDALTDLGSDCSVIQEYAPVGHQGGDSLTFRGGGTEMEWYADGGVYVGTTVDQPAIATGSVADDTLTRWAAAFGSTSSSVVRDGGTVHSASHNTRAVPTSAYCGGYPPNGSRALTIKSLAIYSSKLDDATLQAKSVIGATY